MEITKRSPPTKSVISRGEWKVAALVVGDELTVNINAADLVYRSEMKKEPLTRWIKAALWKLNHPGIPQGFIGKQLSVYLGTKVLPGKREPGSVRQMENIRFS